MSTDTTSGSFSGTGSALIDGSSPSTFSNFSIFSTRDSSINSFLGNITLFCRPFKLAVMASSQLRSNSNYIYIYKYIYIYIINIYIFIPITYFQTQIQ